MISIRMYRAKSIKLFPHEDNFHRFVITLSLYAVSDQYQLVCFWLKCIFKKSYNLFSSFDFRYSGNSKKNLMLRECAQIQSSGSNMDSDVE